MVFGTSLRRRRSVSSHTDAKAAVPTFGAWVWFKTGQSLVMYEVGLKVKKASMWCWENSICFLQQEFERRSGQSLSAVKKRGWTLGIQSGWSGYVYMESKMYIFRWQRCKHENKLPKVSDDFVFAANFYVEASYFGAHSPRSLGSDLLGGLWGGCGVFQGVCWKMDI